jgi:hypothetical protein
MCAVVFADEVLGSPRGYPVLGSCCYLGRELANKPHHRQRALALRQVAAAAQQQGRRVTQVFAKEFERTARQKRVA